MKIKVSLEINLPEPTAETEEIYGTEDESWKAAWAARIIHGALLQSAIKEHYMAALRLMGSTVGPAEVRQRLIAEHNLWADLLTEAETTLTTEEIA